MSEYFAVEIDSEWAPCAYILCRCSGEPGNLDWNERDESATVLVQTDWDYPGLASSMGWVACECGGTDGTVDCAHRTAGDMISEAAEWIDEHLGQPFEDSGYF